MGRESKRKRWQFSIRAWLVLLVVFGLALSFFTPAFRKARRQRKAVASIIQLGGNRMPEVGIWYDDEIDSQNPDRLPFKHPHVRNWLDEFLHHVVEVNLFQTEKTDEIMRHVGQLTLLERLSLERTDGTGLGLSHLKTLAHLKQLRLDTDTMDDSTIACIADLPRLETFDLRGSDVGDTSVDHISNFKQLKRLDIRNTGITHEGYEKIRAALSDCTILIELKKEKPWIGVPRVRPGRSAAHLGLLPTLIEDLKHQDSSVRAGSAVLIGDLGHRAVDAVPALAEAVSDNDRDVRRLAIGAISVIATSERRQYALERSISYVDTRDQRDLLSPTTLSAVPALVSAIEDDCEHVRVGAFLALWAIHPKGDAVTEMALARRLRHEEPQVIHGAAKTLVRLKATDAATVEVIEDALQDDNPTARNATAYVLGEYGKTAEAAVPVLLQALDGEQEREVRRQIETAVEKIQAAGESGRSSQVQQGAVGRRPSLLLLTEDLLEGPEVYMPSANVVVCALTGRSIQVAVFALSIRW